MTSISSQIFPFRDDMDDQVRERIICDIGRFFVQKSDLTADVILVYVYGSFLTTDRFNDIDIGILVSGERKPYDLFKYSMLIASRVEQSFQPRCEVDLRILNGAPIRFLYEVIRTGRIVYARDEEERIAFEADVLTTYLDLLPMFEMMDQALIAR